MIAVTSEYGSVVAAMPVKMKRAGPLLPGVLQKELSPAITTLRPV